MTAEPASQIAADARAEFRREAGFALLEVIVAAAIAALALVALFQAGSAGLLSVNNATRVEAAVDRAQSRLALFADTDTIAPGESQGEDGDGYHWRVTAHPIAAQPAGGPDRAGAPLGLYHIAVTISWGAGRHQRSVVLETERIARVGVPR